eukprot:scaffold268_cov236-Pinguiococcus_pyrenoidosus.AAC.28
MGPGRRNGLHAQVPRISTGESTSSLNHFPPWPMRCSTAGCREDVALARAAGHEGLRDVLLSSDLQMHLASHGLGGFGRGQHAARADQGQQLYRRRRDESEDQVPERPGASSPSGSVHHVER